MPQSRRSTCGGWQAAAQVALGLLLALPVAAIGPGGPAAPRAAMLKDAIAGLGDEVYLRRDDAAAAGAAGRAGAVRRAAAGRPAARRRRA
jgi:hypothetical protein